MPEREKIVFEIKRHICVLNNHESGWNKELNLISWNGQKPKYDVRDWDQDHARMGRGITLYPYEMRKLVDAYIADNNKQVVETAKQADQEKRERLANNKRPDYVKSEHGQPEPEQEPVLETEAGEPVPLEPPPFNVNEEEDQTANDTF